MFTGIIRHVGAVRDVQPSGGGLRLTIDPGPLAEGLGEGDSVAVSGACLTVCGQSGAEASFDVVAETVSRTTLGDVRAGAKVNLERSLAVGATLDGHFVQGHVDGVATVRAVDRGANAWRTEFAAPKDVTDTLVAKGSVAIDGVSLTVADVGRDRFAVALIPTTLAETTLADLAVGDRVNVETDVIGKYVRRCLEQMAGSGGGLTMDKLREAGFA